MSTPAKFRLQGLFEIRERAKADAEKAFVLEQTVVQREIKTLENLNIDLANQISARENKKSLYAREAIMGDLNIEKLQTQERHLEALKEKIAIQKHEVLKQEKILDQAELKAKEKLSEMLIATKEFKSLEKVKEGWVLALRKESDRKDDEAMEDISQAQYFHQRT